VVAWMRRRSMTNCLMGGTSINAVVAAAAAADDDEEDDEEENDAADTCIIGQSCG